MFILFAKKINNFFFDLFLYSLTLNRFWVLKNLYETQVFYRNLLRYSIKCVEYIYMSISININYINALRKINWHNICQYIRCCPINVLITLNVYIFYVNDEWRFRFIRLALSTCNQKYFTFILNILLVKNDYISYAICQMMLISFWLYCTNIPF